VRGDCVSTRLLRLRAAPQPHLRAARAARMPSMVGGSILCAPESMLCCIDVSCSGPLWGAPLILAESSACDVSGKKATGLTPVGLPATDEADSGGARVCAKAAFMREAHALDSRPRCTRCQLLMARLCGEVGRRARAGVDARSGGGQHGGLPGKDEAGRAAAVRADHSRARPRSRSQPTPTRRARWRSAPPDGRPRACPGARSRACACAAPGPGMPGGDRVARTSAFPHGSPSMDMPGWGLSSAAEARPAQTRGRCSTSRGEVLGAAREQDRA